MDNQTKFGEIEDAGQVLRTPARLDTIGATTMSEKIVSKFDREAFVSKFEQLPPKAQDSYLSFLELLMVMTPEEHADFTDYIEGHSYDADWAALLSAMLYAFGSPDERERSLRRAGLRPGWDVPACEGNE